MARMKPDTFEYSQTNSNGEKRVYESLRDNLDNSWLVCHSWRWLKHYKNHKTGKIQGEGDFVIFHPDCGMIVIEVKGGSIEYRKDGKYYANNHLIQNPEKQASDTKFYIVERLKEHNLNKKCYVRHGVWFPDIKWKSDFPPNLNKRNTFDESDLKNPQHKLHSLAPPVGNPSLEEDIILAIEKLLHNPFKLVKSLRYRIEDTVKEEVRLTHEQIKVIEALDELNCLGIKGRAGTGKTLLAINYANQIAKNGIKILFLCYNKHLEEFIKSNTSASGIDVFTFYRYAISYLSRYKPWRINYEDHLIPDYFNKIAEEFTEVIEENFDNYTTCIVDEAQDLKAEWFFALKNTFLNSGKFYFFFDPLQVQYTKDSNVQETHFGIDNPIITLHRNLRNTRQVSMASLNIMNLKYNLHKHFNNLEGEFPEVLMCNNNEKQQVEQKVNFLINLENIKRESITILSMVGNGKSCIGKSIYGIPVTTYRKFKGLENDVILLVDVNYRHLVDEVYQRELYAALTRSRYLSIIFFDNSFSLMKESFCRQYNISNPDNENIYSLLKLENYE